MSPKGASVHIAQEEAIIIWDAAAKTQHFIRRAVFDTNTKNFGFLVPTPAQPELEEAGDEAFRVLAKLTEPEIRQVPRNAKSETAKSAAPAPAVAVLERKKVAGLDAAVLEATKAEALDAWLKGNGYLSSPELVEWYKPYIAAKWKITAFKIDAEGAPRAQPGAVRMSFAADTPFFPYREPATATEKPPARLLRVYMLASERLGGVVGSAGSWAGETVWSGTIREADLKSILKLAKLPDGSAPGALWLTEFEDRASPRQGTDDVFFQRAADQSSVKRDPILVREPSGPTAADWDLIFILAAILGLAGWLGISRVLAARKRGGVRE